MPTALIPEDDKVVVAIMSAMLERAGWTVLQAESAAQALEQSERHNGPIHLLIADVLLTEGNGGAVAMTLDEKRPQMACLFVSGYPLAELYRRALLEKRMLASRRRGFLQKPFTLRAFRDAIGRMTEQAASA